MIEDTGVSILITDKPFAFSPIRKINPGTLTLDVPRSMLEVGCSPEDLAYVMYTSGSTGQPKGVAVPQRAVVRLVKETNFMRFGPDEVFLQFAPVSFDASTLEIWGSLLNGAKLVLFPPQLPSLVELGASLREHQVTTLWLTAGLFHQMVDHRIDDLRGIKQLLAGGDVLSVPHVKKVLEQLPHCELINGYGPTENTTFTCCYSVPRHWNGRSVPIGKPISNTQVYVLDKNLEPVPIGVPGELHIGGDGLARGYLNRPELNTEKFISSPFHPNERLYKTGDKVRWLADGTIEFFGRIDNQVKIRGFRIELEEIEAAISQHPLVQQTTVIARNTSTTDKELVGYVVLEGALENASQQIRNFLQQKLPGYMIPTHFVALNEFPLTANGKINKQSLPPPEISVVGPDSFAEPKTSTETQLQKIWENLLGRKKIGVRDNFFDLGGHSLLAVRLFAQIEKDLGEKLPLALLFQSPTIEQLASAIEAGDAPKSNSCLINIQPNGFRPPMFWLHTLGGGGGGGVLRYQKLSQFLGPEQPSYGLVAPPEPFTRIEVMAAHYIKTMRTIQPVGPYHLGGYCFGGVVAFEMAQQLQSAGEEVALLALLDSSPPNVVAERNHSRNGFNSIGALPKKLQKFFKQDRKQMRTSLERKAKKLRGKLRALFDGSIPESTNGAALEDVIDMANYPADYKHYAEVHWDALNHYTPKFFDGKITLIESTNSPMSGSPGVIWKTLARDLEIRSILATHETMLEEPHVQIVAAELNECLKRCRNDDTKICAA
jgi:amino acid adenylation domain-containing protein